MRRGAARHDATRRDATRRDGRLIRAQARSCQHITKRTETRQRRDVRTDDFGSRPVGSECTVCTQARTHSLTHSLTRSLARAYTHAGMYGAHGRWNVRASENDLPPHDSHRGAKELRSLRRRSFYLVPHAYTPRFSVTSRFLSRVEIP